MTIGYIRWNSFPFIMSFRYLEKVAYLQSVVRLAIWKFQSKVFIILLVSVLIIIIQVRTDVWFVCVWICVSKLMIRVLMSCYCWDKHFLFWISFLKYLQQCFMYHTKPWGEMKLSNLSKWHSRCHKRNLSFFILL